MSEKEENTNKKQETTSSQIAEEFKKLIAEFKHTHQLNDYELIDLILGQKTETKESIPADCFNINLGSLETIVKYLKENKNLNFKKIAEITGRTSSAITSTYNKAKQKQPEQLTPKSDILIPIHVLTNKKLSVLGNITVHLKENCNMKLRQIGKLINRSEKTIWTAYHRAKRK